MTMETLYTANDATPGSIPSVIISMKMALSPLRTFSAASITSAQTANLDHSMPRVLSSDKGIGEQRLTRAIERSRKAHRKVTRRRLEHLSLILHSPMDGQMATIPTYSTIAPVEVREIHTRQRRDPKQPIDRQIRCTFPFYRKTPHHTLTNVPDRPCTARPRSSCRMDTQKTPTAPNSYISTTMTPVIAQCRQTSSTT